jgi:hypothetical protein
MTSLEMQNHHHHHSLSQSVALGRARRQLNSRPNSLPPYLRKKKFFRENDTITTILLFIKTYVEVRMKLHSKPRSDIIKM